MSSMHNTEGEKISVMIDSGASELVANADKFSRVSAGEDDGQRYLILFGRREWWCRRQREKEKHRSDGRALRCTSYMKSPDVRRRASATNVGFSFSAQSSRLQTSFFTRQDFGSYMECKTTGLRRWLRQEHVVFYFDLWVKPLQF